MKAIVSDLYLIFLFGQNKGHFYCTKNQGSSLYTVPTPCWGHRTIERSLELERQAVRGRKYEEYMVVCAHACGCVRACVRVT